MSKRNVNKLKSDEFECESVFGYCDSPNIVKRLKITRQPNRDRYKEEDLNDFTESEHDCGGVAEHPFTTLHIKKQSNFSEEEHEEEYENYLDDELIEFMGREDNLSLESSLGEWASSCNITLYAFNKLLKILRDYHPTLPENGKEIETFKRSGSPLPGLEGIEIGVENLQDSVSSALKNQRAMMKQILMLKQTVARQQKTEGQNPTEQQRFNQAPCYPPPSNNLSLNVPRMEDDLNLPCETSESFLHLDEKCREDPDIENKLRDLFLSINDWEVKKFINKNLSTVFEDDCAQMFSWVGLNGKLTLKRSYVIKLLYNVTQNRFSHVSEDNILEIIKKWFHLAKDRVRKKVIRMKS